MPSVRSAEKTPSEALPKTAAACAPAPAAPMVWATVLRLRMAASGRSTSDLRPLRRSATTGFDAARFPT